MEQLYIESLIKGFFTDENLRVIVKQYVYTASSEFREKFYMWCVIESFKNEEQFRYALFYGSLIAGDTDNCSAPIELLGLGYERLFIDYRNICKLQVN